MTHDETSFLGLTEVRMIRISVGLAKEGEKMNGKNKLESVLFADEFELVNVKFFAGTSKNLTADQLAEAAATALKEAHEAWMAGVPSQTPETGLTKRTLVA